MGGVPSCCADRDKEDEGGKHCIPDHLKGHRFIANNSGHHPREHYDVERTPVGVGGYGSVRRAKHKGTHEACAVKTIKKSACKPKMLKNEIEINMMLDHPNIIRMRDVYEDPHYLYIVMESCEGGEVLARILDGERFTERDASIVASQLLHAVTYLHSRNICHRDLKLENLLLLEKGVPIAENTIRLIDFGFAKRLSHPDQTLKDHVGTPHYVAPEVLSEFPYTKACDYWSIGVMLYIILSGIPPFHGPTEDDILREVERAKLSFDFPEWKSRSSSCQDLIAGLLRRDVRKRTTSEQALHHPWLEEGNEALSPKEASSEGERLHLERLHEFQAAGHFKRMAMHLVAHRLDEHEIADLKHTFMRLDENGDGRLSLEEIKSGCVKAGVTDCDEICNLFKDMDADHSNSVDYTEFLAATMDHHTYFKEEVLWEAFRVFDLDGDGKISRDELREVLESEENPSAQHLDADQIQALLSEVQTMVSEVDSDGDGSIDFQEFVAMVRGEDASPPKAGASPLKVLAEALPAADSTSKGA